MKRVVKCLNCSNFLKERHNIKYCSNKCQWDMQYKIWVKNWKIGEQSGGIGITAKNISGHLKRYLREKFNGKCAKCGWDTKHPITKSVPLEIEHLDGNSENNSEKNLLLLCPNCHSLSPFYKNLNRGNGRQWRIKKYIRNK